MSDTSTPAAAFLATDEPLAVVRTPEADAASAGARMADWTVVLAPTPDARTLRELQAAFTQALDLPADAATNLDALADHLRDLPDRPDEGPGTVLVWEPAAGVGLEDDALLALLELLTDVAADSLGAPRPLRVVLASDTVADQLDEEDEA